MICLYAILYNMFLFYSIWFASLFITWYASMLHHIICCMLYYITFGDQISSQTSCDGFWFLPPQVWLILILIDALTHSVSVSLSLCLSLSISLSFTQTHTIKFTHTHTRTHTLSLTQILDQHTLMNTRALTTTLTPSFSSTHYFSFALFSLGAQYSYKSRSSFRRSLQISRRGTRKVRFFFHFLNFVLLTIPLCHPLSILSDLMIFFITRRAQVRPVLTVLLTDKDRDVQFYATESMKFCA